MSTPVRKCPKALAGNYRLFVVGDANELGVCCAALNADPVEISRYIGARYGVVDLIGPKQAFACSVVRVPGCCPWTLEVSVFGLPDVMRCANWADWLRSIGA
jgi:hypothetical protein